MVPGQAQSFVILYVCLLLDCQQNEQMTKVATSGGKGVTFSGGKSYSLIFLLMQEDTFSQVTVHIQCYLWKF